MLDWANDLTSKAWDAHVNTLCGHPLQSAMWGNAKTISNNIPDERWRASRDGEIVFLARVEIRRFLKWKIAWIPKGPVFLDNQHEPAIFSAFLKKLKERGFILCCTTPWKKIHENKKSCAFTIWIDLRQGETTLWKNLHKQFRYDVKRAQKLGVIVKSSAKNEDLEKFYSVCAQLSQKKRFRFSDKLMFMQNLVVQNSSDIESLLFFAEYNNQFCGGALIIRFGRHVHYMWGAVDRTYSHLSIGQAIQWEIIQWALTKQCVLYDLEGISAKQNSGVDYFKKRLGGEVIMNPGFQFYPKTIMGWIAFFLIRFRFLMASVAKVLP